MVMNVEVVRRHFWHSCGIVLVMSCDGDDGGTGHGVANDWK